MRPYVSWLIISNDSKVVIYWTIQIFYKKSANLNGVTILRSYVGINKREPFVSCNQIRAVRHSSSYFNLHIALYGCKAAARRLLATVSYCAALCLEF